MTTDKAFLRCHLEDGVEKLGTEMFKVKARPTVTGTPGERLSVTVDLDRAHLFDASTGLTLSEVGR